MFYFSGTSITSPSRSQRSAWLGSVQSMVHSMVFFVIGSWRATLTRERSDETRINFELSKTERSMKEAWVNAQFSVDMRGEAFNSGSSLRAVLSPLILIVTCLLTHLMSEAAS